MGTPNVPLPNHKWIVVYSIQISTPISPPDFLMGGGALKVISKGIDCDSTSHASLEYFWGV